MIGKSEKKGPNILGHCRFCEQRVPKIYLFHYFCTTLYNKDRATKLCLILWQKLVLLKLSDVLGKQTKISEFFTRAFSTI